MEAKELTDIALGQSAAKCRLYDKGYFKKRISNLKSIQIQTVRAIVNTKEPVRTGTKCLVKIPHTGDKISDTGGPRIPKNPIFFKNGKNHQKRKNLKMSRHMPKLVIRPSTRGL